MEPDKVIRMRNALKAGMNLPVKVLINNTYTIIDEGAVGQFTKWDDENGILYSYRLTDMQSDTSPSNVSQTVSLVAIEYNAVEGMEVSALPYKYLSKSIDSLTSQGATIADEFKNRIISVFGQLLRTDMYDLTHEDINKIVGYDALNTNDDYYAGRFKESFQETRPMDERNKYVDSLNKNPNP